MRRPDFFRSARLAVLAVLLPAAALPRGVSQAGPVRFALPNGLRVVVVPAAAATDPVEVTLLVQAGHGLDPTGASGVAEITVGALPNGSQARSGPLVRSDLLDLGATLTPSIARDYAAITLHLADRATLEPGLALLADVVTRAIFPPHAVEAVARRITTDLVELRSQPAAVTSRLVPTLAWGAASPDAGLPDPWTLRSRAATQVVPFYQRYYRPERAVLVVAGADPAPTREAVTAAFGRWWCPKPSEPATQTDRAEPESMPPLAHVAVAGKAAALGVTFVPSQDDPGPLARYLLTAVVAASLGEPAAAGSPFPASGLEGWSFTGESATPRTVEMLSQALAELAHSGVPAERFKAVRAGIAEQLRLALKDPAYLSLWLALAEASGIDPDPRRPLAAVNPREIQSLASSIVDGNRLRAIAAGPAGASKVGVEMHLFEPDGAKGRAAAERGQQVLRQALLAQGEPRRLRAIEHLDLRALGTFYGSNTEIDLVWRLVASLPDRFYIDSKAYRQAQGITTRVAGGEVTVEDARLGLQTAQPLLGLVVLRQTLRQPALALIRPYDLGLVRWLGEESDAATGPHDLIEVLDPAVGTARYWVRRADRALTRLSYDLLPVDGGDEEHFFDDFDLVQGVRVPWSDRSSAAGWPLTSLCYTAIDFPESVDPAIYTGGTPSAFVALPADTP